jgi:hypothetical protein
MKPSLSIVIYGLFVWGWTMAYADEPDSFKTKWNRLAKNSISVMKVSAIPGEEVPEATLNLSFGPGSLISVARGKQRHYKDMLEEHDIVGVINRNLRVVKYCYCKALKKDPRFEGQAIVGMQIKTNGHVSNVGIEPKDMNDNLFGRCLTTRVLKWRFPKFKGLKEDGLKVASVGYEFPLEFSRAE